LKNFPLIRLFLLILLTILLLTGCAEQQQVEYIRIKSGPPPEIIAEDGKPKMVATGLIKRRLRLVVPSAKNVVINDRQYIYITEKWFRDVIKWTEEFIALQVPDLNLQQKYPLAYDETFATLAANIANISVATRYNVQGSVLIGLITAKHEKSWGAIPADGKKRVYLIGMTEKGGLVYDLHTRQSINFDKFPNFDSISGIIF
jgi:hypothetical protein